MKRRMGDISRPAPVPSTAIYSRTDGIANWRTCIEEETPLTDNVEVYASHCGMGFNPAIYYVIGDRLAQPRRQMAEVRTQRYALLRVPRRDLRRETNPPRQRLNSTSPAFSSRFASAGLSPPSGCPTATSDTPPTTARRR